MIPKRIQLRRTKGWRKPGRAVVVARPSRWGNPYVIGAALQSEDEPVGQVVDRWHAVELYRRWLTGRSATPRADLNLLASPPEAAEIRDALAGRDLACWCPPDGPCHADVLLQIANGGAG